MNQKKISIASSVLFGILTLCAFDGNGGCNGAPASDQAQEDAQERISQQGNAQVGMPGITNFTEKKVMRRLYGALRSRFTCYNLSCFKTHTQSGVAAIQQPRYCYTLDCMAAIQVNMGVSEVLLARIDSAAIDCPSGEGRTQCILEACRMRLDGGSFKRPEPESLAEQNAQKDTSHGVGDASAASVTATGDSQPRPNMQARALPAMSGRSIQQVFADIQHRESWNSRSA